MEPTSIREEADGGGEKEGKGMKKGGRGREARKPSSI